MTVTSKPAVWRPYEDEPILTPAMARGPQHVPAADMAALAAYLVAFVTARAAPVHVNVAFNAAYFGYDLSQNGYVGGPLDLDVLPTLTHGERRAALPVGVHVALAATGSPLFGEVVYREGAHPQVNDDGSVPPWLSGAPTGATPPRTDTNPQAPTGPVSRRELLVVDFAAFSPTLAPKLTQLDRLRQKERYVDANGHVTVEAQYASTVSADTSEASQYQQYLLTRGRDLLQSASAPLPLATLLSDGTGEADLEAALAGIFATVAAALASMDSVRLWGAYAFPRAAFGLRLGQDGAFGGEDLGTLATQLASSAAPRRSRSAPARTVTYTAVGPVLGHVRGAGRELHGTGYATLVAHANTVVGDYARREVDENTGLLANGVHLRVDDTWQSGGIWRAERPGVIQADADVTDPLGLGWAEAAGLLSPPEPEPESAPDPEPEPEPEGQLLSVTDSQVMWTQTLRLAHQLHSYLPVPPKLASLLDGVLEPGPAKLTVHHEGHNLDPDEASQDITVERSGDAWTLTGATWPLEYFAGIVLLGTWQRGGRLFRVQSTLLDAPVTVDGFDIAHRYDPAVLTREGPTSNDRDQTWPARILATVRKLGLLDVQGCALIAQERLLSVVAPDAGSVGRTAAESALDDLVERGKLTRTTGGFATDQSLVVPCPDGAAPVSIVRYIPQVVVGSPRRPPVPAVLRGLISTNGLSPHMLREIDVAGHLRWLPPGHQASAKAQADYRQFRARYHLSGPTDLPAGRTFVNSFLREV